MAQGEGVGEARGGEGGGIIWAIIWFLLLIFVSFWIAGFCAWWYILLLPLTVCVDALTPITDILLKGVQLPHFCAKCMVEQKPLGAALS